MTVARNVVPGRTYLISRRCTQRQLLLRPDERVENIYLYCLGEAAGRYNITIHGFVAMSNHQHLVVRDNDGNFPEFLAHFHKMVAKAMNVYRGRWENFWASEQPNAVYLVAAEDRFAKLVYTLANPVLAHLVERVSDWPGANSFGLQIGGRTKTVPRPVEFFRPGGKMPDEVTLRVERPEGFEALSDAEWVAKLRAAVEAEERTARAARLAAGRGVVGRKEVLRADPTAIPATLAPRRELRPHVACLDAKQRVIELAALRGFRRGRLAAMIRLMRGERDVVFPFGTYRVRAFFLSAPASLPLSA